MGTGATITLRGASFRTSWTHSPALALALALAGTIGDKQSAQARRAGAGERAPGSACPPPTCLLPGWRRLTRVLSRHWAHVTFSKACLYRRGALQGRAPRSSVPKARAPTSSADPQGAGWGRGVCSPPASGHRSGHSAQHQAWLVTVGCALVEQAGHSRVGSGHAGSC